jgi:formylglycine-generating enzyme required for sulfatase activity
MAEEAPLRRAANVEGFMMAASRLAVVLTALALLPVNVSAQPARTAEPPAQIFPAGVHPLTPERERALKPKDSFKECDACPEMVVVPKGTFMMGTPPKEEGRFDDEFPLHKVTIAQPFAVGRFKISFDEWDACLADGGCGGNRGDDNHFGRGRLPAHGISFEAAKSYLAWLSKKVGRTYRLPSEAEREYFTRAGTTTAFWFGKTISAKDANYYASITYAGGPRGEDAKAPKPVDAYAPNRFGLYQVHGNGWEWTEDCYNKRLTQDTPTNGSAWLEGDCNKRIVRGGPWNWHAYMLRSGHRYGVYHGGGYSFRVVRSLNTP